MDLSKRNGAQKFIKRGSYVKVKCSDGNILDGIIKEVVLLGDSELEAAILLEQQEETKVELFGCTLIPLSFIACFESMEMKN